MAPTPYPDVNAFLLMLLAEVRAILGERLVGLYLYGSLSSGDFDPGSSDIDFLVVTQDAVPEDLLGQLQAMHTRIALSESVWATRLEGSYIPRVAMRRYDPGDNLHPTIGADWPFGSGAHGSDWIIQRHIVRESGVTLFGPPPCSLIDPISAEALRGAAIDMGINFWAAQLDGPEWLRPRHYQAFAILTMCRILYTIGHGSVVSKLVAAAWARGALEPTWAPLIERALRWRHDTRPDDMAEMLHFIQYTVDRCRDAAKMQPEAS